MLKNRKLVWDFPGQNVSGQLYLTEAGVADCARSRNGGLQVRGRAGHLRKGRANRKEDRLILVVGPGLLAQNLSQSLGTQLQSAAA